VRSLRIGCGMISRGEVGLIVTAMGASTGIFGRSEVAVMVAVVLLTTLLTPVVLRGAFQLRSVQDLEEGLREPEPNEAAVQGGSSAESSTEQEGFAEEPPEEASLKMDLAHSPSLFSLSGGEVSSDAE
jgi:hypothetical protein